MKTAISIPDSIFQAAEALANWQGVSRSECYTKAIEALIEHTKNQDVTARLNQVYSDQSNALTEEDYALQAQSLDKEEWP